MKSGLLCLLVLSLIILSGCQKAQSRSEVSCPREKNLPVHTIRYPMSGDNKGPYPVIVATVPHPMGKEMFTQWLDAHKKTHFVVALPPKEIHSSSDVEIQRLLKNLSCRYSMDLSRVEWDTKL